MSPAAGTIADASVASPILIVDDREDGLLALRATLEPLGHPILTARSGDEALRHLLRHEVAVILLDVNMPGMDGFSTASLIKRRERTRDIPIIFLTADRDATERGQVELGYSSGAADFLVKPFDPWVLMSKVGVFVELHRANAQLRRQLDELRASRAALAAAQRIARLAHFDVDVDADLVTWSEQAAELLGTPPTHAASSAGELLPFWDQLVDASAGVAFGHVHTRFARADGARMTIHARAEYRRDRTGRVVAITGTVQDVTQQDETRRALEEATSALERESQAVALLQESMLPAAIPQPPGLEVAARYLPADVGVGGDWYDVSWRRDGRVMLVIGDVAGHGLRAAATMNEIRIAARAFSMRDPSPRRILQELNGFTDVIGGAHLVTALIVVIDPVTGEGCAASAGHLPPLIDTPSGPRYLDLDVAPPLGVGSTVPDEVPFVLPPDGRLLMFTDGLVEQRHRSIDARLAMLAACLRAAGATGETKVDELADRLVESMLSDGPPKDDVAVLVVHRSPSSRLDARLLARPENVATLRATLRRWLEARGAGRDVVEELVLAAGELVANSCIHAYPTAPGDVVLTAEDERGELRISVADQGTWRAERERGGGRGLSIVRQIADRVEIHADEHGTTVTVTRALADLPGGERVGATG